MCGISGIIGNREINTAAIKQMMEIQVHRGPDADGAWASECKKIVFGHRRLAILDLSSAGIQPMTDTSGQFIITFNGEIYNYLELKAELRDLGSVFQTETDTEVILESYKVWGEQCPKYFNGMFAFAIYDKRADKIFCARDRFGEKPFLFVSKDNFFGFSSEYKALLQLAEVSLDYDEMLMLRFLYNNSEGLDDQQQTIFRDIKQLLPGESLTLNVQTLKWSVARYWNVEVNADFARLSENDSVALFRELLIDSIRIRLRSDVPVGSCLSGGLDSSSIVCIAKNLIGEDSDYNVFTGRFPNTEADEWNYAKQIMDQTKLISHVTEPTPEGFVSDLESFIWHNELPVGSTSQYAQWCIFRLAKEQGVTVLLDGQGGDELLGGYEQYFLRYLESLKELGEDSRLKAELPLIKERYPLAILPSAKALFSQAPLGIRKWLSKRTNRGSSFLFGLNIDIAKQIQLETQRRRYERFNSLTSDLYRSTFQTVLPTLLRYGDRNSMAHSREVRLPFCDYRLAELAFSLPPWHLMGEIQTKRLLRESMRGILPEGIRTRWNKQGFRPPQPLWFSKNLLGKVESLLAEDHFIQSDIWDKIWWQKVLKRLREGETHLAWILWAPFIAELWHKYFIKRIASTSKVAIFAK